MPALTAAWQREARWNVLFVLRGDLNDRSSPSGDEVVRTPNLDAPARRGVRLDWANCQYPPGSRFRALLMTGIGPEAVGVMEAHAEVFARGERASVAQRSGSALGPAGDG